MSNAKKAGAKFSREEVLDLESTSVVMAESTETGVSFTAEVWILELHVGIHLKDDKWNVYPVWLS